MADLLTPPSLFDLCAEREDIALRDLLGPAGGKILAKTLRLSLLLVEQIIYTL
jgi:hypothetical protein